MIIKFKYVDKTDSQSCLFLSFISNKYVITYPMNSCVNLEYTNQEERAGARIQCIFISNVCNKSTHTF